MIIKSIFHFFLFGFMSIYILPLNADAREDDNEKINLNIVQTELEPEELLNVGILIFDPNISEIEEDNNFFEIRKAESNYLPYHLKVTLEQSGHWGGIWVLPDASRVTDLVIVGKILQSDGLDVRLQIGIWDLTGKQWINKEYSNEIKLSAYSKRRDISQDPYQVIFNSIANDMVEIRNTFSVSNLKRIEEIGEIRYANEILPGLYNNYLVKEKEIYQAIKLPADNDTMINKVRDVKERELLMLDTVNEHYGQAYQNIIFPYAEWRRISRESAIIYADLKRSGRIRKALGAAVLIGAIASDGDSNASRSIQNMGVYAGMQAIQSGMAVSKEADKYKARISESTNAFNDEVQPINIQLEGQTIRLTGNAEEMFTQWRALLKSIYIDETGLNSLKSSTD